MITTPSSLVRCAIYCRKSSDDGLDQAFNSLDAQRESGEAYITSQKALGWVALPERFEDGGFSGGNMDRPALTRLLAEIEAGKVDRVVVYKIDRLTRSIRDFGRIVEVFEKHNVSFTSVTQAIDTGTSMGRLMLHILLSFAAFERELASERTRDKIKASRQRGLWTGGRPVLGYDLVDSNLVVNEAEAKIVRSIFEKYLEHRSLRRVLEELDSRGIRNKTWTSKTGSQMGGSKFVKNKLWHLLSNPLYVGKVPHKSDVYPGVHTAIVDQNVFDRVQRILTENGRAGPSLERNRYGGVLKGLLRCAACGCAMTHTTTTNRGVTYRYYCCHVRQSMGKKRCSSEMLPAEQVETFVLDKVRGTLADPALVAMVFDVARAHGEEQLRDLEARRSLVVADLDGSERVLRGKPNGRPAKPKPESAERHEELTEHLRGIERQISDARARLVTRAGVHDCLEKFESVWAVMSPAEKNRLLGLLIERAEFDSEAGEISLIMRSDAPATVAGEVA